jgi:hypothetical protein
VLVAGGGRRRGGVVVAGHFADRDGKRKEGNKKSEAEMGGRVSDVSVLVGVCGIVRVLRCASDLCLEDGKFGKGNLGVDGARDCILWGNRQPCIVQDDEIISEHAAEVHGSRGWQSWMAVGDGRRGEHEVGPTMANA